MRDSGGVPALALALVSAAVGVTYFSYLTATPWPPTVARVVPCLWLVAACWAVVLAVRTLRTRLGSGLAWVGLALGVVSAGFALVFTAAALLGD